MLRQDSLLKRSEQTLNQQIEDSQVLLKLNSGHYYALDEIGIQVWQLCDGRHSVADIVSAICAEYDAPVATIEADVNALLQELLDEGLLLEDR